jgi:hypothetical protein
MNVEARIETNAWAGGTPQFAGRGLTPNCPRTRGYANVPADGITLGSVRLRFHLSGV